ncbi:RING-type domain-containing protein [Mycena chlorophos]|uniref:RING-type domain-containing protein n=1 Tax=Mycena chlorophos TaxID=658473 RepID=A0A8H6RXE3_MYCCL|nr:RING-type domain-containing protein [Mycena chlorophos]
MTITLTGCVPGQLDPEQRNRLLRRPSSSTLSFANFDPRVASAADLGLGSLSLNDDQRRKRVVIETTCSGEARFRFVPRAQWEEGVVDEGKWPRLVNICGQLVNCSEDQWDIYKLDPFYDCTVHANGPPTITMALPKPVDPQPLGKHRRVSPEPCFDMPPPKLFHLDDSEGEMSVDEHPGMGSRRPSAPADRARRQQEKDKKRQDRREKGARRVEILTTRGHSVFNFASPVPKPPSPEKPKRKASSLFDSLRTHPDPDYYTHAEQDDERNALNYSPTKTAKRTRTYSPGAAKRDLETRRLEREKQKRERREREWNLRKEQKFQQFLNEVYLDLPNGNPAADLDEEDASSESDDDADEEAERRAAIAESRRKLAELEADRPLWEQEARRREQRERQEDEALRAKAAQRRAAENLRAEQERRARVEKERQEEERRRAAQEQARRDRERRQRSAGFSYGPWTSQRALERYNLICVDFDNTQFSAENPLDFDSVPWPVLFPPHAFGVEDIGWTAVEQFFKEIKAHMRPQDYLTLLQKSHRRFHPDKWRSRLRTVGDETEREFLELGVNSVAQAITPIWQELR